MCFPKDSNPTAQEVQERFKQVSSLFKIERASEIESLELKNKNTYVYKTVEKAYLELLNEVNPDSKKYEKINCFALRLESLKAIARKKQRYYQ